MPAKLAIAILAGAFALAVPAAAAEVQFRGQATVTEVTVECTNGPHAGDTVRMLFHPRTVTGATNANYSAFNFFGDWWSNSLRLDGADFSGSLQTVEFEGIGWSDFSNGAISQVSVTGIPAISTTTVSLAFSGEIKNPRGQAGQENCLADIDFVGVRE